MKDEKPASEEMQALAAAAIGNGQTLLASIIAQMPPEQAALIEPHVQQFANTLQARIEQLYKRMQIEEREREYEEQERAQMRGLLELFAAMEMPADEWGRHCPFCGWNVPDFDDTPNHKPDCPIAQARALLAGGKEQG